MKMFDTCCVFHFDRFVKATISWLNLNVSVYKKKRGQMRSLCASVTMCVLFVRDPPQIPNFVIKKHWSFTKEPCVEGFTEAMFTVYLTKFYHNISYHTP